MTSAFGEGEMDHDDEVATGESGAGGEERLTTLMV